MSVYQDPHLLAIANAVGALGNRIGLYAGSTRVGTVYTDTTWGSAVKVTEDGYDWGKITGSAVTISVPASTVSNGTVIDGYGVFNGSTLLRRETLPITMTVNNGSLAFSVDVTPSYRYRGL